LFGGFIVFLWLPEVPAAAGPDFLIGGYFCILAPERAFLGAEGSQSTDISNFFTPKSTL
jgi:hypothetical protein